MTEFLSQVEGIVGDRGVVTRDQFDAYLRDQRGYFQGDAKMIVRPKTTDEVAAVVALCARSGVAIVPQGGNTGLCGGATPDESGQQIVLSLSRMDAIREIDPIDHSVTVESGAVLQHVKESVAARGMFFPLDLGARGSCQIGGNISTNAGGINVLRYGNTRELVLGVEVVLPDGRVWDGLSKLRKDNTGYDLKQLFIGAEGTLGIVTAAVLKLFPAPALRHTAFIAVKDPAAASALLGEVRRLSADAVVSFEYIPRLALELLDADPLETPYQHYVLLELISGSEEHSQLQQLEDILARGFEDGNVLDAVLAQNDSQREVFWQIRESISPAQRESVKNDISVPVSRVVELLDRAPAVVENLCPGARPCPFGHIGDGNIHYNILGPVDQDPLAFRRQYGQALVTAINELVIELGGSFSAEHGVGQLRRDDLYKYKHPLEVELMQRIKDAFDPHNLFNPGKIL